MVSINGALGKNQQKNENKMVNNLVLQERFNKFEKYISTVNIDDLIYRIILEHDDEWIEYCGINGREPYPNNKLEFIIKYVLNLNKLVYVKELNNVFEFKNYYFKIVRGQDAIITKIYDKCNKELLLDL